MIWFVVLTILMNDGKVITEVHPANTPEFNNEQSCMTAASLLADQKSAEIGTANGKVFYICDYIPEANIDKVLGRTKS